MYAALRLVNGHDTLIVYRAALQQMMDLHFSGTTDTFRTSSSLLYISQFDLICLLYKCQNGPVDILQ